MSIVITVGREFGSGGRELGRRIADELKIAYYDKEILEEVKKRTPYSLSYIESISEDRPFTLPSISYGNSFMFYKDVPLEQHFDVQNAQVEFLKEIAAKSSCVIIGRAADYILRDMNPFRIFVYADMQSKIERCKARQKEGEPQLTDKQWAKKIKLVDKKRRNFYDFYTGQYWAEKESYDIMVNTSHTEIKLISKHLADMLRPAIETDKKEVKTEA